MFTALSNFFRAPQYEKDPAKTQDAGTAHRVAVALLFLGPLSILFMLNLDVPTRYYAIGGTVGGMFVWLFTIYMIKREWIIPAKIIILTINTINLLVVIYFIGNLERPTIFATLFLVALATLLFPRRGAFVYGAVLLLLSGALFVLGRIGNPPEPTFPLSDETTYSIYFFTLIAISALLEIVSANMRSNLENSFQAQHQLQQRNLELDELRGQLEIRVEERTKALKGRTDQLEAIADVARSVATIQEMDRLLSTITRLVSGRFGFYHVGIFLLDNENQFALLQAANSEGGAKMLARGHRLQVGKQGIVGYVTSQGVARIALDVGEEAVFFNNPDLPDTHSEVALPLKFRQKIFGALDIQSTETNAFSQEDVDIFSVLADQISVAIQNVQSLEQTQRALREAEIATSQLTGIAWQGYTEKVQAKGYRYNGIRPEPLKETTNTAEDSNSLTVPVQLRGQTIGRLKLKSSDASHKMTEDELAIITSTADRVALAMDGARLLDEAQKRATRETFLSQVGSKLSTSFQLDSILRDTVEELGQTLKDSTVTFQLVNPSAPPTEAPQKADQAAGTKRSKA